MTDELIAISPHGIARHATGFLLPAVIADAGDHAASLCEADKHRLLAYCTAMTLTPKLAPADGEEATAYDVALSLTGADVAAYWRPAKASYFSRITRGQLLTIGRDVLGEQWVQPRSKDKKSELADALDRAFTSPEKGVRAPEQVEKLKRWLPAGMGFTAPAMPKTLKEKKARRKAA
jgi:ParB family chromosome partitioning protein